MGNPIEDDSQLAMAVGRTAGRMALVEMQVEMIFSLLLKTDIGRAAAVFSFYRSVGTQVDAILKVATYAVPSDSDAMKLLKTTLQEYRDLAGRRNAIIHNPFGWDSSINPPQIYKMVRDPGKAFPFREQPMSVPEIEAFNSDAELFLFKLIIAQNDLMKAMYPGSPGLLASPLPGQSPEASNGSPESPQSPDEGRPPQPQSFGE